MGTRAEIKALLEQHGLHLKRSFGQSFLVEDRVLDGIARAATRDSEGTIVEIGTGLGTLTRALAKTAKRVVTIERDRTLIPVLETIFQATPNVRIVEGDALEARFSALVDPGQKPAIAGNLPYSITTPLLLSLLHQRSEIGPATIMIQREVADRLLAQPGGKEYGSLSVLFQMNADIEHVFDVAPGNFIPPPKVYSTVLRLVWLPSSRVAVGDPAHLERVVRAAFSQRRKTLRNALSSVFARGDVEGAASASGIALERRAETLSLEEFARLAAAMPPKTTA
jgi:16S rRNA (adenine1518-N6/adenine1519-N6)-dimethyltransferase